MLRLRLRPTPPPSMITPPQSRPLRQTLLLGLVMIGMMFVGAVFLYFVTDRAVVVGRIRPQLTIIPSHSAALAAIDRRNIVGGLRLALARPLVLEVKKSSPTS